MIMQSPINAMRYKKAFLIKSIPEFSYKSQKININ